MIYEERYYVVTFEVLIKAWLVLFSVALDSRSGKRTNLSHNGYIYIWEGKVCLCFDCREREMIELSNVNEDGIYLEFSRLPT